MPLKKMQAPEERPHRCSICSRRFKELWSLQNHINIHYGIKPFVCGYCTNAFTTSGERLRHVRYRHTHEKLFKCRKCDYEAVEASKVRRHARCHTRDRPYKCPDCTYACTYKYELKRHLQMHSSEKSYQSNALQLPKLTHNVAERPVYSCDLCPAKCSRKADLLIHIKNLHTSGEPIECNPCGKKFPDRYSYKMHKKTHVGEKCFKCNLCPYASTRRQRLTAHTQTHSDDKPFLCAECGRTFSQKPQLRRHENHCHRPDYVPKLKEKSHVCRVCKRPYALEGNLTRHLATHDAPGAGTR